MTTNPDPPGADYGLYALKIAERPADVFASLQQGEGRFGWSYVESADLAALRARIEKVGWDSLSTDEKDCYQSFLLDLRPGDWVVFINTPSWGRCTVAQVTGGYYWVWADDDFNHRFKVDPNTVLDFDRNDAIVHPALSARLKLQGRKWQISTKREFDQLREALAAGKGGRPRTLEDHARFMSAEVIPLLNDITDRIQRTHPNYALEGLLTRIYKRVPGVIDVRWQGGPSDHGADILVTVEDRHPLTGTVRQSLCVVQVKSFEGDHWDTRAAEDIRRAFDKYPDATSGLIVSTARRSAPSLEASVERVQRETGKPVSLLIGAEVAIFVIRYADDILGQKV